MPSRKGSTVWRKTSSRQPAEDPGPARLPSPPSCTRRCRSPFSTSRRVFGPEWVWAVERRIEPASRPVSSVMRAVILATHSVSKSIESTSTMATVCPESDSARAVAYSGMAAPMPRWCVCVPQILCGVPGAGVMSACRGPANICFVVSFSKTCPAALFHHHHISQTLFPKLWNGGVPGWVAHRDQ